MKKILASLLFLIALLPVSRLHAEQTVNLDLFADGDTRWFELFSDAFEQLDKGFRGNPAIDGPYVVSSDYPGYSAETFDPLLFEPTEFDEIGISTGIDAFPNEPAFSNSYSVEYDDSGLTGSGTEVAPITAFNLAFNNDIAPNDAIVGGYDVATSNAYGTVTLFDGVIESIDGGAAVTHSYDFSFFQGDIYPYAGDFVVSGRRWTLLVDDTYESELSSTPLRYIWDAHGYISSLYESGLAGDYNNDGVVDAADYTVWRDNLGERQGTLPNDVDGGMIEEDQYLTWSNNYGSSLSFANLESVPTSVPEPLSGILLASGIGVLSILLRRNRRGC